MESRGELRIDPGQLGTDAFTGEIELVVPYTDLPLTRHLLKRAEVLTAGLHVRIKLLAIHAVPYPAAFRCPTATHSFLVDQLLELADTCSLPVDPQVILARSREEGFRYALKSESTILLGTRRHLWRTAEERLARSLVSEGHKVALLHLD
jgi:hypothetical protein